MKVKCKNCLPTEGIEIPIFKHIEKLKFIDLKTVTFLNLTKYFIENYLISHQDAKFLVTHINKIYGHCNNCNFDNLNEEYINCPKCGALNFNWQTEKGKSFDFFKTQMPDTRKADFYLGCLDGSVFIDFNQTNDNLISLFRISFDGYGCYNISDTKNLLNHELSKKFVEEISKEELDLETLTPLIKELIKINQEHICTDALEEYHLIDRPE